MTRFAVQFVEMTTYLVEVEADDEDAAIDAGIELVANEMSDMYERGSETETEQVTNLETGVTRHCR